MEGWLEKRSREGWAPQYVRVDADRLTAHESAERGAKAIVVVELAAARVIGSAEAAQATKPFTVLPAGVATKDDSGRTIRGGGRGGIGEGGGRGARTW